MKKSLLLLPGPVTVAHPVLEAMARPLINHRDRDFAELLERTRGALAPVFGTGSDILILGCSGTGGLEAALVNCFSPGDRLLSCSVGAFGERFAAIARTYGCTVEPFETPAGAALDPDALAHRLDADTQRHIRGILLTHNETSTGVQNDMRAIGPIVRRAAGRRDDCCQRTRVCGDGHRAHPALLLRPPARTRIDACRTDAVDAADFGVVCPRRRTRTVSRRRHGRRVAPPRTVRACGAQRIGSAWLSSILASGRPLGNGRRCVSPGRRGRGRVARAFTRTLRRRIGGRSGSTGWKNRALRNDG